MSMYSFWIGLVYPYLGKRLHNLDSQDFHNLQAIFLFDALRIRMSSCVFDGPSEFYRFFMPPIRKMSSYESLNA